MLRISPPTDPDHVELFQNHRHEMGLFRFAFKQIFICCFDYGNHFSAISNRHDRPVGYTQAALPLFKSSYDSHFALSSEHFHVSGMSCQESGFELKHCFWSVCLLLESALRAPNHTMRVFLTSRLFRVFFSKTPCNAYQVSVENQVLICFIEKTAKNRHM